MTKTDNYIFVLRVFFYFVLVFLFLKLELIPCSASLLFGKRPQLLHETFKPISVKMRRCFELLVQDT